MLMYKTVEVEFEVDLSDYEDDELIEELNLQGYQGISDDELVFGLVSTIYENRRRGQEYSKELDELCYLVLGRI